MSCTGGGILYEKAYAQGKMLDSSGWRDILPRKITPSDIDCVFDGSGNEPQAIPHVFDNMGYMLFMELSSQHSRWCDIATGQRWMYRSLIAGQKRKIAALCKHSVSPDRAIKTTNDIDEFQVMFNTRDIKYSVVFNGDRWVRFVAKWHEEPQSVLRYLEKNQEPPF